MIVIHFPKFINRVDYKFYHFCNIYKNFIDLHYYMRFIFFKV
jgi:hypothetical protein